MKHIHNCNHVLSFFKLHDTSNVCNDKGKYWTILWASGNYDGRLALKLSAHPG